MEKEITPLKERIIKTFPKKCLMQRDIFTVYPFWSERKGNAEKWREEKI